MPVQILVATPHAAFGELLRLSLEEQGRYRVSLSGGGPQAEALLSAGQVGAAILDEDLGATALQTLYAMSVGARARVVLIPADNDPRSPSLAALPADGYLTKPFYLPDLVDLMERLVSNGKAPAPAAAAPALPAESVQPAPAAPPPVAAASPLDTLLKDTNARAVVVVFDDPVRPPLYAGAFPQETGSELAGLVRRYWNREDRADLVRFARLETAHGDFQVFATAAGADRALGMAYDADTPLSRIRSQAARLARALAETPGAPLAPAAAPAPPPGPAPEALETLEGDEPDAEAFDLSALLGNIPAPDPEARPAQTDDWLPEFTPPPLPWEEPDNAATQPAPPAEATRVSPSLAETRVSPPAAETRVALPAAQARRPALPPDPPRDDLEDTRPRLVSSPTHLDQLESAAPGVSQLAYTCALVPRMPHHFLAGELADRLSAWLQQLCLAFGWRLEGIQVRPEYMQWTVQVAPAVSPGNLVKVIRRRTSESIFEAFPGLSRENPSGDFWAAGYLIVSGAQPPSARLLREFIQQTRRRQGLPPASLPPTR